MTVESKLRSFGECLGFHGRVNELEKYLLDVAWEDRFMARPVWLSKWHCVSAVMNAHTSSCPVSAWATEYGRHCWD
jgi:hypothetical protein